MGSQLTYSFEFAVFVCNSFFHYFQAAWKPAKPPSRLSRPWQMVNIAGKSPLWTGGNMILGVASLPSPCSHQSFEQLRVWELLL